MRTSYGTGDTEDNVSSSPVYPGLRPRNSALLLFYAAVALGIVGLATTAAVLGGNKQLGSVLTLAMVNADGDGISAYNALNPKGVLHCNTVGSHFLDYLPRFDAKFMGKDKFHNACYYAYRCCTTTSHSEACLLSDNFGPSCRGCMARYVPRRVRKECKDYLALPPAEQDDPQSWNLKDLLADKGLPDTEHPELKLAFTHFERKSCWVQPTQGSQYTDKWSQHCFKVISWCNQVCPRDASKTVKHTMCKHCEMYGFETTPIHGYFDLPGFHKSLKEMSSAE